MDSKTLELLVDITEDFQLLDNILAKKSINRKQCKQLALSLRKLLYDYHSTLSTAAQVFNTRLRISSPPELPPDDELFFTNAYFTHASPFDWQGIGMCKVALHKAPTAPEMNWVDDERPLTIQTFLNQRVMAFGHYSVKRIDVLRFVAHKLGGVHLDSPKDSGPENTLKHLRNNVGAKVTSNGVQYIFKVQGNKKWKTDMVLKPSHLDPTMMELLATTQILLGEKDVQTLRSHIQEALLKEEET